MDQMSLLKDWLETISDDNNSVWMQESPAAFQVSISPEDQPDTNVTFTMARDLLAGARDF